jgi:hypothetical protein
MSFLPDILNYLKRVGAQGATSKEVRERVPGDNVAVDAALKAAAASGTISSRKEHPVRGPYQKIVYFLSPEQLVGSPPGSCPRLPPALKGLHFDHLPDLISSPFFDNILQFFTLSPRGPPRVASFAASLAILAHSYDSSSSPCPCPLVFLPLPLCRPLAPLPILAQRPPRTSSRPPRTRTCGRRQLLAAVSGRRRTRSTDRRRP